jgi:hypothetical protein
MGSQGFARSIVIAVLLGIALRIVLSYAWSFEATHISLFLWLHASGWSLVSLGYVNILTGFLADTLLSLPAAWVLLALRPQRRLLYLILAVIPCFICGDVYFHWKLGLELDLVLALAYAKVLLALPLATWILLRLTRQDMSMRVPPSLSGEPIRQKGR